FTVQESWKNAITYTAKVGGTCGIVLHNLGDGYGELVLFFDKAVNRETRLQFEEYISAYLQRRALRGDFKRSSTLTCISCGAIMTDQIVRMRRMRDFTWLACPVCSQRISLLDPKERLVGEPSSRVIEMDHVADRQRERETTQSIMRGKIETKDF